MPKVHLTICYYPIRGKAQVCRLLCEYLGVNYIDRLFSLVQWEKQRKRKNKNIQIPYLQEQNFTVSGPIPMCLYIIDRFSNGELLGKNLNDQALVDMYLWTIQALGGIIKINCQKKSQKQIRQFKEIQWNTVIAPKLQKYEDFAQENKWFLGYLTIIDFSIYELMRYIELIFQGMTQQFPKLKNIEKRLGQLPQIKSYQQSQYAIKQMCPTTLLKQLKQEIKQRSVVENEESEEKE